MSRALKVLFIGSATLMIAYLGFVTLLRSSLAGNETDNAGDLDDAPDFYVSDPSLVQRDRVAVQATADPADGEPRGARYFVRFADGRFAWGLTSEEDGKTRPLYTHESIPYTVYWHGDAWKQWYATPERPRDQPRTSTRPAHSR